MKKTYLGVVLTVLATSYLYLTNFDGELIESIKKLIDYNVSELKEPKTVSVGEGEPVFLDIPEGFEISVAASGLENPRVILFDPKGRMLVSETKAGRVSILEGAEFETKRTLIKGLKSPHGLAFYVDDNKTTYLYIAETQQVARYVYDVNTGKLTDTVGKNITNLPTDGQHFTRTIAFGPNFRKNQLIGTVNTQVNTKLYMSVGSSCDVCEERTWKRAAILESDPEGSYTAEFAGGLRNSVFFTFHPITKEIWATEMGRDNLGDNLPPDEVNIVRVAGSEHKFGARRYGWPFCYGDKVKDETFKPEKWERIDITSDCSQTEPPVIEIPAHSAPLGLAFIPSNLLTTSDVRGTSDVKAWPKEWGSDLLVAFHGSWNRSEPTGYKIVRYDLDKNGNVLSPEPLDFISGWLSPDKKNVHGRPVDLKFGLDGALYISDDALGNIYRVIPRP